MKQIDQLQKPPVQVAEAKAEEEEEEPMERALIGSDNEEKEIIPETEESTTVKKRRMGNTKAYYKAYLDAHHNAYAGRLRSR